MKKRVFIELRGDSWRVVYAERMFRGRHQAACFYAKDTTLERVKDWVKNNHRLELVDPSKELIEA